MPHGVLSLWVIQLSQEEATLIDPRMEKLADMLIGYSLNVQPGERVLIEFFDDVPSEMGALLIDRVAKAGGLPFINLHRSQTSRAITMNATQEQMEVLKKRDLEFMKDMDCYLSMRAWNNDCEFSDVPAEKTKLCQTYHGTPVLEYRVNQTRWTSMQWPTPAIAQKGSMSTQAFEDFYFDVCTLDYSKMAEAAVPLVERMARTDRVHIIGPGDTDIEFSIKGIPIVPCTGNMNIPDGEIFTAPVKETTNGVIHYNVGSFCQGKPCDDIRLVFKDGKIIEATGSDPEGINKTFDTDEGARYVGEFAIGINPCITKPMRNTLFDEKISGSIHLTPGMAYEAAFNGNKSKVHWDLVMIQTAEYGGGEMWFDDELIRKDGLFVPDYLQGLNPENLL